MIALWQRNMFQSVPISPSWHKYLPCSMKFLFCLGLLVITSPAFSQPSSKSNKPLTTSPSRPLPAVLDTLLNVNGHALHFNIWRGQAPAILFEAGGGDDLSVWNDILAPIYRATGATLITYDRAGFGRSELDSNRVSLGQQVADLHACLSKLPGTGRYLLVGHSFGGFCSTLFAARYPKQVVGAVLVDANHVAYFTNARVRAIQTQYAPLQAQFRNAEPGKYWMLAGVVRDQQEMQQAPFPSTVPVVDIVAERPPFQSPQDISDWKRVHQQFVAAAPNRRLVNATGSGHYVMKDQPKLLIKTITQFYQRCLPKKK